MSVIGIDFGNENCYVAAVRSGGIEVLSTDTGQRMIPCYIGFGEKIRCFGSTAKSAQVINFKNTIYGFKHLVGRKFFEEFVRNETTYLPYVISEMKNGFLGVKVNYRKKEAKFYIEQLVAMLLSKLKEVAEKALNMSVSNCVIAVPSYFNDSARRAMLDAGRIAGLNVIKLINEHAAVAFSYGFYKHNLSEDKSTTIVFVDLGHSVLQVSVCAITKSNVKVLSNVCEIEVGGRDFDNVIVRYFAEEFQTKYNLKVFSSERAIIRLLGECEKLKKQLSANPQSMPLNIECFMEDKDVSGSMNRKTFEDLCSDLLRKAENAMRRALAEARQHFSDISAVELVGGSSRIPAIKQLVQKVFRCEPSTTLNLDEAVARGCALQCAMFSPNLKVRDFCVADVQPYPIRLIWTISRGEKGEIEVFPRNQPIPVSKFLTYFKTENFTLDAYYGEVSDTPNKANKIGSFTVCGITRSPSGESSKVQIKVRVDIHGIFSVRSACILDADVNDTEPPDQNAENLFDIRQAMNPSGNNEMPPPKAKSDKKDAKSPKIIDLTIQSNVSALSNNDMTKFIAEETSMVQIDKLEEERVNAKNALEEFIYEIRSSLEHELKDYIEPKDFENFINRLGMVENWLYGEGEEQNKNVYIKELTELKNVVDPVILRKQEFENIKDAISTFNHELQNAERLIKLYSVKDQEYAHLGTKEIEELESIINSKRAFLESKISQLSEAILHKDPPFLAKHLSTERESIVHMVSSLVNKGRQDPADNVTK